MKYDFTTLLNRKGHDALALDVLPIKDVEVDPNFSTIPMWVADMNLILVILKCQKITIKPFNSGKKKHMA